LKLWENLLKVFKQFWINQCASIYDPREIELYGKLVSDEHLKKVWMIGTTPEDHIKHIEHYIKLGFRNIHVTSSSPDEKKTISMYGGQVIPYLKSTYK